MSAGATGTVEMIDAVTWKLCVRFSQSRPQGFGSQVLPFPFADGSVVT